MSKHNPLEKRRIAGFVLLLLFLVMIFQYLNVYSSKYHTIPSIVTVEGWQYSWGHTEWTDFAAGEKLLNEDRLCHIRLRFTLPEGGWNEPCLLFRSVQQDVKVYIEDSLVHQYGSMDLNNTRIAPGSTWNFITLPESFQGKEVIIELYSPFIEYAGFIEEVQIGSKSDLILNKIYKYFNNFVLGWIFIFIGLALTIIYFASRRKEIQYAAIGMSSVFIGIWVIMESKVIQFFINSPLGLMYTAYTSIFLMPVGFCVFIEQSFGKKNQVVFKRLIQAFIIIAVLAFGLELTHVVSIFYTVKLYHLLLIITMILSIITIIQSARSGNKEANIFAFGLFLACLTGVHDIISIFYPKILFSGQRISQWGILVYTLTAVYLLGKRLKSYHESLQMNYQSLFKNMIDALIYCKVMLNENHHPEDLLILEINQASETLLGFKRTIIGKKITEIIPNMKNKRELINIMKMAALTGEKQEVNSVKIFKQWYNIAVFTPLPGFLCVILKDITEQKKTAELISYQAFHDSVTGVFNRMYFEKEIKRINKEMEKIKYLSIISIDLDGLKVINDTFGHSVGDNLLKEAALIISASMIFPGFVARIGGDEFCVIMEKGDSAAANSLIDDINRQVNIYNDSDPFVPLSMSLGFAAYDSIIDKDIYSVYKRADDNMYQYKLGQTSSMKSRVVEMLQTAISKRDYVSEGHVERLIKLAELMADKLKISDQEKRNLVLLSKMHDLGKIGISDEILFKTSKLNEEEFSKMKEHSKIGYSIANRTYELSHIASLILHHHEYWNGRGYPDGLQGAEIPLECRILTIIDAYDAMTSKRPYSDGMSKEEAISELKRCAGSQFDPDLVDTFIGILQD